MLIIDRCRWRIIGPNRILSICRGQADYPAGGRKGSVNEASFHSESISFFWKNWGRYERQGNIGVSIPKYYYTTGRAIWHRQGDVDSNLSSIHRILSIHWTWQQKSYTLPIPLLPFSRCWTRLLLPPPHVGSWVWTPDQLALTSGILRRYKNAECVLHKHLPFGLARFY